MELAGSIKLDDPRVFVAVGDIERTIGRKGDSGRPVEVLVIRPRHALLAQLQNQLPTVMGKFENLLTFPIDDPHMPVFVVRADSHAVGHYNQIIPLLPVFDDFAVGVQHQDLM